MPTAILCEDPTTVHYIPPAFAVINGDASCFCHLAVPVETTTWGQVKSLYE